jgi:AcrR family transcriptional regulator
MLETELLSPEKAAQILRGATVVFARDGYEGASMSRIAAEAGVSKGTLYNYFASKSELFAAYVQQECSQHLSSIFEAADMDGDPEMMLKRIASRMLQLLLSGVGITVYRVVISEAEKFPDLARAFFEAGPARAIRYLAGRLQEQTAQGRLAVPDPEFAAEQFFALCQTRLAFRCKLHLVTTPSEEEVQRVVDATVTMFLNTYRA